MTSGEPGPVRVTGGVGGIVANRDAITHLAFLFGQAGSALESEQWWLHQELRGLGGGSFGTEGDGALDFVGLAEVTSLLEGALSDLGTAGERCRGIAKNLLFASAGYPWGDDVFSSSGVFDALTSVLGDVVVFDGDLVDTHSVTHAAQTVLARDPGLLDSTAGGLGFPELADALSQATDGTGVALETGIAATGVASVAPRGLTDVVRGLGQRDHDPRPGAIDVRILTGPDGRRSAIVDITGTRRWTPGQPSNVADLYTNERAVLGKSTAYEQGVLAALRQAGVRATDEVMLVGHSQGGLIAVNTARDAVTSGEFNVTHVITAGAPVGLVVGQVPKSVRVLALENSKDVVPHTDGRANPPRPNVTTVSSSHGDGTITGDHSIHDSYEPVAADTETSRSHSVRDFLTSADGYFRATAVTTHTYQVVRR